MNPKLRQLLLILLLPAIADFLLISCCDCPTPAYLSYSNCELFLEQIDNAGPEPEVAKSDTILKQAYGIRLTVERRESMCWNTKGAVFGSAAYAYSCSCDPDVIYASNDSAVSLQIITLTDFDSTHQANSDVSEFFLTPDYQPVSSLLERVDENVNYDFDDPNLVVDLLLFTPPTSSGNYQFRIIIEFSDGKIMQAQTQPVYLQ